MTIDKIELMDRVALLRKSWQKSLKISFMRGGMFRNYRERANETGRKRDRERKDAYPCPLIV